MLRSGAIILTFWTGVRLLLSPRILARFAYTFFSNPKAHSYRIHVFKREVEAFTGRARLCFVRRRRLDF